MKKETLFIAVALTFAGKSVIPADAATILSSDTTAVEQADSIINLLDKVTVTAYRSQVKLGIDRIGYDVQADDEAKTQTAMDILRKVPLVTIEGTDNIYVKGEKNFKIYKNGHYDMSLSKNAKDILKAMPASAIKRIEVITEPGAREDAESGDAILNIVMMDKKIEGVTGSVSASTNMRAAPNISSSLTSQFGKAIINVIYGFIHFTDRQNNGWNHTERTFANSGNTTTTILHRYEPGQIHYANIGASYDIDSLNLVTASFGGYFSGKNGHGDAAYSINSPDGPLISGYNESYRQILDRGNFWDGRIDYEHSTPLAGEKITVSYMFGFSRNNGKRRTSYSDIRGIPLDYTGIDSDNRESSTQHTVQFDYIRPLSAEHKLEVGSKYIHRNNESHNLQTFYDAESSTSEGSFSHISHITALYADYTWSHGPWAARAGLRYEHTFMKGHYPDGKTPDFHRHLNDWVPQASLMYKLAPLKSLKLSYNTSIARPGIYYLNPYVNITPTSVDFGNEHLRSVRFHSVGLTYTHIGSKITFQLSPQFRFHNNGIDRIIYADGDIRYSTYDEVLRNRQWQVNGFIQWRPFVSTTVMCNLSYTHFHIKNTFQHLSRHGNNFSYFVDISQKLPWKLRASAYFLGNIGRQGDVYSYSDSYYAYRFALQRSFLSHDRLSVSLAIHTPFRKNLYRKTHIVQGDFTGFSEDFNKCDSRQFVISASFRFGNLKPEMKRTSTTINNNDEVGGITR